jgi:hypothetical protein
VIGRTKNWPIRIDKAIVMKKLRLFSIRGGSANSSGKLGLQGLERGGEDLAAEEIRRGLRKGVLAAAIVPVYLGSAFKNKGIQPLLDAVIEFIPNVRGRSRTIPSEMVRPGSAPTTKPKITPTKLAHRLCQVRTCASA